MPVRTNREYRSMDAMAPVEEKDYIVEGYASTFKPYVLVSIDGVDYYEQIDRNAFDSADMSDVIMQYDHSGKVYARQSNGTLSIETDDHGLKIRADLSKTDAAKELYEEIRAGMITEMSFAFVVDDDGDDYIREEHKRVINRVKKVYDVSAVSRAANPDTAISARSYFDGVIEMERQELQKAEKRNHQIRRIKILLEV